MNATRDDHTKEVNQRETQIPYDITYIQKCIFWLQVSWDQGYGDVPRL